MHKTVIERKEIGESDAFCAATRCAAILDVIVGVLPRVVVVVRTGRRRIVAVRRHSHRRRRYEAGRRAVHWSRVVLREDGHGVHLRRVFRALLLLVGRLAVDLRQRLRSAGRHLRHISQLPVPFAQLQHVFHEAARAR